MRRQGFSTVASTATLSLLLWFAGVRTAHFDFAQTQTSGSAVTSGAACVLCDTPNCALASPVGAVLAPLFPTYIVAPGHATSRLDAAQIAYRVRPPPAM
jgi:hypothetical protein